MSNAVSTKQKALARISRGIITLFLLAVPPLCLGQSGIISTVAGNASHGGGSVGDGGPATSATLTLPRGVTVDASGNLYILESFGQRVRKVNTAGIITTVAGTGVGGFSSDGGPATSAQFLFLGIRQGLAVDSAGNLYICDDGNNRIRKVDKNGIITTVAGNGPSFGAPGSFSGDGGPATSAGLHAPAGVAVDSAGNLYIADTFNYRIRKVNAAGIITTFAGSGAGGFGGDGGPATSALLAAPTSVAADSAGNVFIGDYGNSRIRKVNPAGIISTVAGTGGNGYSGDGGPATSALFHYIMGVAVDQAENLYIAGLGDYRIRRVDKAGIVTTIAGNGTYGYSGDGGPATSAELKDPTDVAVDASGNLYITDQADGVIRKVTGASGSGGSSGGSGGATLAASPALVAFSYTAGGSAPASQTLNITSSGAALNFTVSATALTGGSWLTVSPTSGTTPAMLTVSAAPAASLTAGNYVGIINLSTGSGSTPVSIGVTLAVSGSGGPPPSGAPTISANGVLNACGFQAKLAPDTFFIILGSGLGPASLKTAPAPNYPMSVGGTSVTFTPAAGGAAINVKMVWAASAYVAGVLPSSITPGTYAVQVAYSGQTSAPQNVTVVARSFGIATSNSGGTGAAQATIANVNKGVSLVRFTSGSVKFAGLTWTLTPAHPGDTLTLWGTGGGADPANDTGGSSGDQTKAGNFIVTVGGRQITPSYAGSSSGYPGLWLINFKLPADITPDCFASVQVSAGGELSNPVTIAIAAAGQNACSAPGFSPAELAKLDASGNIVFAGFGIGKLTVMAPTGNTVNEVIGGQFGRYSAAEWIQPYAGPKFGACTVYDVTYPASGKFPSGPDAFLDAGSHLTVSGPNLASGTVAAITTTLGPVYHLSPAAGTLVPGGTYTLTGSGGTQIGAFSVSSTLPSSFTVTNIGSINIVDRTQPLTINWTGSGVEEVNIEVIGDALTSTTVHAVAIGCAVPGNSGTLSIPAAALAYLPPIAAGSAGGAASIGVTATTAVAGTVSPESSTVQTFVPPLLPGGQVDFGAFTPYLAVTKAIAIQ